MIVKILIVCTLIGMGWGFFKARKSEDDFSDTVMMTVMGGIVGLAAPVLLLALAAGVAFLFIK